jgi:hypothetical protein
VTCDRSSGFFPLGVVHTVNCTASDASNNSASGSFTVTVQDTTDPTVTAPADVSVEGNASGGAMGVILGTPSAFDVADSTLTITDNAPTFFPVGVTIVTYSTIDDSGNTGSDTQQVTVFDPSPPTLTLPPDITVQADSSGQATVTFNVTATDTVDPSPLVACDPTSGSVFNLGVTPVDCIATDSAGNSANGTFNVIVVDACDCAKGQGFWKQQFKERSKKDAKKIEKGQLIAEDTLNIYLGIVQQVSSHFDEVVPLSNMADANNVFDPPKSRNNDNGSRPGSGSGSKDATNPSSTGSKKKRKGGDSNSDSGSGAGKNVAKKREQALEQTLSAWLNFAKGAIDWTEQVDTNGDGSPDATFADLIAEVESILNNPDATQNDLEHAKDLAEAVNQRDKDNADCETGTGSKTGTATRSKSGGTKGSGTTSRSSKPSKGGKKGK